MLECGHSVGVHVMGEGNANKPFGWNMGVTKRTVGGSLGYFSEKATVSSNVPPSYGVSTGLREVWVKTWLLRIHD